MERKCGNFSTRKFVTFFLSLEHYKFPALRIHNLRSFLYSLVFSEILLNNCTIPIPLSYEDEVKGQIDGLLLQRMCT